MRFSKSFIPTLKENPADAEIPSHRLMIRSGMLRKTGAGIYSYLPLAKRVITKIEAIVREELNKIGCEELLMPVLQPKEIWELSGRWNVYGPELMRLQDRHKRFFALGPTHEEIITLLAKNDIKSYKELPINLYQIQTKFRDEIRPRFGVMRSREFIMKDAYSFHANEGSLQETYEDMYAAYSRIFARCGLKCVPVEADVGAIGGSSSHEFMVLAETGESEVLSCECGYAATSENCQIAPLENEQGEELAIEKIYTPQKKSVEEVSGFLNIEKSKIIKTIVYKSDEDIVAILIRGDREINDIKVANFLGSVKLEFASDVEIANVMKSVAGFVGPVGNKSVKIYADNNLKDSVNMVAGADEMDYHFKNVNLLRDVNVSDYEDFVLAKEEDACPKCGKPMSSFRGIEVGQVFKLGNKYSTSMNSFFNDKDGKEIPFEMGCYGIGITRTMASAIEQSYDEHGIIWPISIAPYQVEILNLSTRSDELTKFCDDLHEDLQKSGIEVLYDDREVQPGVKFNDADLLGIPIQIVIGSRGFKNKTVEMKLRQDGKKQEVPLDEINAKVQSLIKQLFEEIENL
ncbi:MAG: proline--tRNA ligase [Candidatus Cloacimonadota bacterium]|nr:proline--tRNA ligase [Candidatus Cloacimonadota bacterium]